MSDLAAILFFGGYFVFGVYFFHFWLRAVKIYLHAKFWVSSSKIERVMVNFVFPHPSPAPPPSPVTNLPVELCASRQLIKNDQVHVPPIFWVIYLHPSIFNLLCEIEIVFVVSFNFSSCSNACKVSGEAIQI